MTYLVKWQENRKDDNGKEYRVILDQHLAELIGQPMKIITDTETTVIPKDVILCDACNNPEPEYVMVDGDYLVETVCEDCRKRYFKKMKVKQK